jgi:xanthine dehydrogenase iron-sulfur cluster and FAD-binding subunit A
MRNHFLTWRQVAHGVADDMAWAVAALSTVSPSPPLPLPLRLHAEIGLTGTKLGCGEGGCGACTVMLSHWEDGQVVHRSANACLCPLYAVEGMHVITVEGEPRAAAQPRPLAPFYALKEVDDQHSPHAQ